MISNVYDMYQIKIMQGSDEETTIQHIRLVSMGVCS